MECLRSPIPTSCADYDNAYQLRPFESFKHKTKLIMFVRSGGSNRKIRLSKVFCNTHSMHCKQWKTFHFCFVSLSPCFFYFSHKLKNQLDIALVICYKSSFLTGKDLCAKIPSLHCGQWLLHPKGGSDRPVNKLTKFWISIRSLLLGLIT